MAYLMKIFLGPGFTFITLYFNPFEQKFTIKTLGLGQLLKK